MPVRTLRAALSKFADLAHMVKPLKRRIFVGSLLPSLERIMRMDGESIQETLAGCMGKLCSALPRSERYAGLTMFCCPRQC